jgi:hypothetical protein
MQLVSDPKDQWVEIVEDYLTTAKMLINMKRADGSIPKGYSATLLLLCATDAIGHGLLPLDKSKSCRFDVLKCPPFNLPLTDDQIGILKEFFSHGLAHVGTTAPDVYLLPNDNPGGHPFVFDQNRMLTSIWVPSFYNVVKAAWDNRKKNVFNAKLRTSVLQRAQQIHHPPGYFSSLNPAVSGMTT